MPLTELPSFQTPSIVASGSTALGAALSLLADRIESEVGKTTAEVKGDWKPLVFLMTDGAPTDNWKKGLDRLKKVRTGMVVACAAGLDLTLRYSNKLARLLCNSTQPTPIP